MKILWTCGDPNGIGIEVMLKAAAHFEENPHHFVALGSFEAIAFYNRQMNLQQKLIRIESLSELPHVKTGGALFVVDIASTFSPQAGKLSRDAGQAAMQAVELAANLCLSKQADAVVTAPLNKEAIHLAGYAFQGHTDFLAHLCGVNTEMMILTDEPSGLRVALATVHVPLGHVAAKMGTLNLTQVITGLAQSLQHDFGISEPRIAVLGLNPHASDGGAIGNEETEVLMPAIEKLKADYDIRGPFSADGFFGMKAYKNFDAVLAMYHDQGLIAFKMLAFETGVNFTAGLPIVRTSPDHGTAFDIAGKGLANATSFVEASRLAVKIAAARMNGTNRTQKIQAEET